MPLNSFIPFKLNTQAINRGKSPRANRTLVIGEGHQMCIPRKSNDHFCFDSHGIYSWKIGKIYDLNNDVTSKL